MKSPSKQLSSEKNNIDSLKFEIETLRKELSLKDEQCKIKIELIEEHKALLKELNDFKEKFKKYQRETNNCKTKYEVEIMKFKKTTKELNDKWNKEYKIKCNSTMERNAQLEIEIKTMKSQLDLKNKEIFSLKTELEKEKISNQETYEKNKKELAALRKKAFELELENTKIKSSYNENQENINTINEKAIKAAHFENEQLKNEINSIKKENNSLKDELDFLKSKKNSKSSSKSLAIDEEFSLKKLETDARFISYYNKREKRLLMIEAALRERDSNEARKLFIIEQIHEKIIEDDIKQQLERQEQQIKLLNDEKECYEEIKKNMDIIKQRIQDQKENPLLKDYEKLAKENISLKEQNDIQKDAYSKFTKAAYKVFSIYKSGFEEIYKMLKTYQKSYESLIGEVDDIALRINVQHPLISFYKSFSSFVLFSPNENQNE